MYILSSTSLINCIDVILQSSNSNIPVFPKVNSILFNFTLICGKYSPLISKSKLVT